MSESKYFFTGDLIKSNIEKIPRFEKGGICNDAICIKLDAFSQIDEIVKDIQEKKDNAMAMEFTKCIGELLKKNGVTPKITEYSGISQTDKTFETRYGVSIDELDFSEHDKVFEDKIEKLEKQIKIYESHKKVLRTRCMESARDKFDKKMYGCLSIVSYPKEIENENKALKQRIVELEKELEEWKEEARVVKKQRDEQLKSFRKGIEPYVDLLHMHETIADKNEKIAELEKEIVNYKQAFEDKCKDYDFMLELLNKFDTENESLNQRIAELESKNEQLKFDIDKMATSKSEWIDEAVEWQQKCEKLEIKEAENTVCVRVSASPIEIATHLINNTCTINELKMIAEHINVYCNGGK